MDFPCIAILVTSGETGGDSAKYLAMNLTMDRQIAETLAVCDLVRGHKRSPKKLWLSFDEWNVWYRARGGDAADGHRKEAPHLLEEVYNLEDALLVGGMLNTLMRNADRVKVACLAQLINVIAPIMTNENGLFRQTIYYPYSLGAAICAREGAERVGRVTNLRREGPGCRAIRGCGCNHRRWQDFALRSQPRSDESSRRRSGLGGSTAEPRSGFTGIDWERSEGGKRLRRTRARKTTRFRQTFDSKRSHQVRSSGTIIHCDPVGSLGRFERGDVQQERCPFCPTRPLRRGLPLRLSIGQWGGW